jgi:CHASE3 domain sensor protein
MLRKKLFNFLGLFVFMGLLSTTNLVQAQTRPYRATDRQVTTTLTRIETNTDILKQQSSNALRRAVLTSGDTEETFTDYISSFEDAVANLNQNFDARRSTTADVEDVLRRAADVNEFIQRNRLNANFQRVWTTIRTDLNTLAGYYSIRPNWTDGTSQAPVRNNTTVGGVRPYRVTDNNVQTLIGRIETRTDLYRRELNLALDRSTLNDSRSEDTIVNYVSEFERATDSLRQNFTSRRSTSADVEEVLNRAYFIDTFMRDYRLTPTAETQWRAIRTDLDTLATYYNVTWNWNRQYSPPGEFDTRITGTYRLNTSQSDDVNVIVDRATVGTIINQRERQRTNLQRRLSSPEMLAIEKRGTQVTIASSTSPQVVFNADGVARTEANANGRSIRVTANTNYDGITLNYEGDRVNDFFVNFNRLSNGQLRVVRRLYLENRNETVTVASIYDKVAERADFSMVNNSQNAGNYGNNSNTNNINDFVIANNTRVSAILRTPISTKTSQNGDRFQMEVTSPSIYNGAIIEGRVAQTERSGRVSGRANLSLEFDTIRLRNGQTYRFAGVVDTVKSASGETISVNNEGTVRDNNQTTKTVTRAGIGAALGALIGAIAGGGQGAVIGAGVGAGAGAGTVILQGRDDVELLDGTEFMITASAPNSVGNNR